MLPVSATRAVSIHAGLGLACSILPDCFYSMKGRKLSRGHPKYIGTQYYLCTCMKFSRSRGFSYLSTINQWAAK